MWPGCTLKSPHGWPDALPDANGVRRMMMPALQKVPFSGLPFSGICGYSFPLPQNRQPGVGTRVTRRRHMTRHASFCVAINATERQIMVWRVVCRAGMILFAIACYATESMVAQAGQPPGWPVFFEAGIPTPSGLSPSSVGTPAIAVICYSKETALWLQPLPLHTLNLSLCLRLSVAQTVIPYLHASHRRR